MLFQIVQRFYLTFHISPPNWLRQFLPASINLLKLAFACFLPVTYPPRWYSHGKPVHPALNVSFAELSTFPCAPAHTIS